MNKFSSTTTKSTLYVKDNQIHIESYGPVAAIEFNYNRTMMFTPIINSGYMIASKNKKMIIISMSGKSIEGLVFNFEGEPNIKNYKAVGADAKYVRNNLIDIHRNTYGKLNSNWDSLGVLYEDLDNNSRGYVGSGKLNNGTIYENLNVNSITKNTKDIKMYYLNGKPYNGIFHIDPLNGLAYTGKKHNPAMKLLSYNKNTSNLKNKNKITESVEQTLGKAFKSLKGNLTSPYKGTANPLKSGTDSISAVPGSTTSGYTASMGGGK